MNNEIRVSAWGIRHNLGPISLPLRNEDGDIEWVGVTQGTQAVSLGDLPEHLKSEFGVTEFEIPDWYLNNATEEELELLRQGLKRAGSRITTVTVDGRHVADYVPEFREDDQAEIERVLDRCATLGVSSARVNIVPPPIVPEVKVATWDEIVAGLRRLHAYAAKRGISLFIENHGEVTSTVEEVQRLLDAVPGLGFILDTGNIEPVITEISSAFTEGRAPNDVNDLEPVYAFIRPLAPLAAVVHVKTYGYREDGTSRVYDIPAVLKAVAGAGYSGPVTIECAEFDTAGVYDTIKRTMALIDEHLKVSA